MLHKLNKFLQTVKRMINKLFQVRRMAYRKTFDGPEGQKVLADLRRFCRATMPTADVDNERVTYLLEGRREVFLRISSFLNMADEDVYKLMESYDED